MGTDGAPPRRGPRQPPACLSRSLLCVVQRRMLPEASLHLQVLPPALSTALARGGPAPATFLPRHLWLCPRNSYKSYKKKEACEFCVSLVLVQSPELVRERERRALPRLPELPGFQRHLRSERGVSPQELRDSRSPG